VVIRIAVCAEEVILGRALSALLSNSGQIEAEYVSDLAEATADSANDVVIWFGDSADVDRLQRIQQLRDLHPAVVCLLVRGPGGAPRARGPPSYGNRSDPPR